MAKSQGEIRTAINDKIVQALEKGVLPWIKPWRNDPNCMGQHHNGVTNRKYRGVNPIMLELTSMENGWVSNKWGTMRQWAQLKGSIKGQKGTWVVFNKPIMTKDDDGKEKVKFFLLKWFMVFNLQQVAGDDPRLEALRPKAEEVIVDPLTAEFDTAQRIVEACKDDGCKLTHGGNRAYWTNDTENIHMPKRDQFATPSDYFETLFHELGHWTEQKRHTKWDRVKHGYAMGELRAEVCCCYLANAANIPHAEGLDNHTRYISSWLEKMREDEKWIFKAMSFADKAADCILHIAGMNGDTKEVDAAKAA